MRKQMNTYYLLKETGQIGKENESSYYIFQNFDWEYDEDNLIFHLLYTFDPQSGELTASPDRDHQIEEITYEDAMRTIAENIMSSLLTKWQDRYRDEEITEGSVRESVSTMNFDIYNMHYCIDGEDLGLKAKSLPDHIMSEITADLEEAGVQEISTDYEFDDE